MNLAGVMGETEGGGTEPRRAPGAAAVAGCCKRAASIARSWLLPPRAAHTVGHRPYH